MHQHVKTPQRIAHCTSDATSNTHRLPELPANSCFGVSYQYLKRQMFREISKRWIFYGSLNLAQFLFAAANQLKGPVQPKQQRRCINCTQYTLATTAEIHTRLIYRCVAGFTVQVVQRQPSNSIPRGAVNHAIPCRILKTSQVRLLHPSSWLPSRMCHCSRHSQGHFPVS